MEGVGKGCCLMWLHLQEAKRRGRCPTLVGCSDPSGLRPHWPVGAIVLGGTCGEQHLGRWNPAVVCFSSPGLPCGGSPRQCLQSHCPTTPSPGQRVSLYCTASKIRLQLWPQGCWMWSGSWEAEGKKGTRNERWQGPWWLLICLVSLGPKCSEGWVWCSCGTQCEFQWTSEYGVE